MPKYKKCPRCEINYILDAEEYCEICKQELRGARLEESLEANNGQGCALEFSCGVGRV